MAAPDPDMTRRRRPHNKAKRILEKLRTPEVVEPPKRVICIRGSRTTDEQRQVLTDIAALTRPRTLMLMKRNLIRPFEDASSVEFLCEKNGSGMFVVATHSKKRPFNFVVGRCFDNALLDMVELGMVGVGHLSEVKSTAHLGSRPCMIFNGDGWDRDPQLRTVQSLLVDLFRGRSSDGVALAAISWALSCSVDPSGLIHVRSYNIRLLRSGMRTPRVELDNMGFHLDLQIRRVHAPEPAMLKASLRVAKELKPKVKKNVSKNALGDTMGRIHMQRQDFSELQLRSSRAMRATKRRASHSDDGDHDAPSAAGGSAKRMRDPRGRAAVARPSEIGDDDGDDEM